MCGIMYLTKLDYYDLTPLWYSEIRFIESKVMCKEYSVNTSVQGHGFAIYQGYLMTKVKTFV
jgi:hypothetical protein